MGSSICKNSKNKKILVIGYYNRFNFGDDAFVNVFRHEWRDYEPSFKNIESVKKEEVEEADLIVLGGGDLLQEYFMKKIEDLVLPYKRCPLYAIGTSVPFDSIIPTGRLDMIDKFWCRFQSDVKKLEPRYGNENVKYIPDIALLHSIPKRKSKISCTKVGLCLSMSLARGNTKQILFDIDSLIQMLLFLGKQVFWLAFNSDTEKHESDIELYNLLPERIKRQVRIVTNPELLPVMAEMDMIIASRFHAHVFGYLLNIPVISLVLTRKIQQWDIEHDWMKYAIKLPRKCQYCNGNNSHCKGCEAFMGYPTKLPIDSIVASTTYTYYLNHNLKGEMDMVRKTLHSVVSGDWEYRNKPPYFINRKLFDSKRVKILDQWDAFKRDEIDADFLSGIICLIITGDLNNECRYGLTEQLKSQGKDFNINSSIEYIIKHFYSSYKEFVIPSNPDGKYNFNSEITYLNKFNHRSGWNYVLDILHKQHNEKGIYMDTFVDRTFGWYGDYLKRLDILPYKKEWSGFIHHPRKAVYSNNDCETLFKKDYFIESLKTCKTLFVMSNDLAEWIRAKLTELNIDVKVERVFHPTELVDKKFKWDLFEKNENKKIVQIGAWLRDPYAIFKLHADKLQKAVLKCKDMEGYLTIEPPEILVNEVLGSGDCCRDIGVNPLIESVRDSLKEQWKTVEIIDYLDNDSYDDLLTQNIVLLPLLEAVAVNTLLECISRNTPVVVKKLPSVVEYLGEDYPLYYNDYKQAETICCDFELIRKGYRYLNKMDKTRFTSEYFGKCF